MSKISAVPGYFSDTAEIAVEHLGYFLGLDLSNKLLILLVVVVVIEVINIFSIFKINKCIKEHRSCLRAWTTVRTNLS